MIFGYMYILWLLLFVGIILLFDLMNVLYIIVVCVNKMLNRWIWVLFLRYEEEFYVIKKYIYRFYILRIKLYGCLVGVIIR